MITSIKVQGFKSLQNFEMDLNPGLNILVGPNGSGKSNVLDFMKFLALLTKRNLSEAIHEMGGSNVIFQKQGSKDFVNEIKCEVKGEFVFEYDEYFDAKEEYDVISFDCKYEYKFTIGVSENHKGYVFKEQEIKIFRSDIVFNHFKSYSEQGNKPGYLERIEDKSENSDLFYKFPIHLFTNITFYSAYSTYRSSNFNDEFSTWIPYDLQPKLIRKDEIPYLDVNNSVQSTGEGLLNTLDYLRIISSTSKQLFNLGLLKKGDEVYYNYIIDYLRLANDSILNFEIEDVHNEKRAIVTIKSGDSSIKLPFSTLSDGTLKWLTLVTIAFTNKTGFSIEEPENFLHPWMQIELIKLLRDETEDSKRSIILTTHSETLLDSAKPEEIILISMKNGATIAKRIENQEEINNAIYESGFGLGYFYISNALENV